MSATKRDAFRQDQLETAVAALRRVRPDLSAREARTMAIAVVDDLNAGDRRRLSVREAAEEVGCSVRSIQVLAIRGTIPGARQLVKGGKWTFDLRKLRQWLHEREELRHQPVHVPSRRAAGVDWAGFRLRHEIDEAYERAMGRKKPAPRKS